MKISNNGKNLIKKYEGCRLKAYKPVTAEQYWTIGWGHYGADVYKGMEITQEQADKFFDEDIKGTEKSVNQICSYLNMNQNQFDALVSFCYNCGTGNLTRLTANKARNAKQIAEHITAYTRGADGKVLPGLVRRRNEEKELFLKVIEEKIIVEEEEEVVKYKTIDEIPEWGRPTIEKLVNMEIVKGVSDDNLGLSEDLVRMYVSLDRARLFD